MNRRLKLLREGILEKAVEFLNEYNIVFKTSTIECMVRYATIEVPCNECDSIEACKMLVNMCTIAESLFNAKEPENAGANVSLAWYVILENYKKITKGDSNE